MAVKLDMSKGISKKKKRYEQRLRLCEMELFSTYDTTYGLSSEMGEFNYVMCILSY